jgi:hypothetical protein
MYIELILFVLGLIFVIYSWLKADMQCPPPKIIYRTVPKHTLDVQFGKENYPSEIYLDMFNDSSPWVGGFTLGMGKTYTEEDVKKAVKSKEPKKD